jgi:hypothetical protein
MPKIISDAGEFERIKSKATEVRIVRSEKAVKVKLRTPTYLYTYTTNSDEVDDLIKGLKDVEVIEYGRTKKKSSEKDTDREKKAEKGS